jgi:hypothetical protein
MFGPTQLGILQYWQEESRRDGWNRCYYLRCKKHLSSTSLCEQACLVIFDIVHGSMENTELFINSAGVAAVAKVRKEWSGIDEVQEAVRKLMEPVVKELSCWTQAK